MLYITEIPPQSGGLVSSRDKMTDAIAIVEQSVKDQALAPGSCRRTERGTCVSRTLTLSLNLSMSRSWPVKGLQVSGAASPARTGGSGGGRGHPNTGERRGRWSYIFRKGEGHGGGVLGPGIILASAVGRLAHSKSLFP